MIGYLCLIIGTIINMNGCTNDEKYKRSLDYQISNNLLEISYNDELISFLRNSTNGNKNPLYINNLYKNLGNFIKNYSDNLRNKTDNESKEIKIKMINDIIFELSNTFDDIYDTFQDELSKILFEIYIVTFYCVFHLFIHINQATYDNFIDNEIFQKINDIIPILLPKLGITDNIPSSNTILDYFDELYILKILGRYDSSLRINKIYDLLKIYKSNYY